MFSSQLTVGQYVSIALAFMYGVLTMTCIDVLRRRWARMLDEAAGVGGPRRNSNQSTVGNRSNPSVSAVAIPITVTPAAGAPTEPNAASSGERTSLLQYYQQRASVGNTKRRAPSDGSEPNNNDSTHQHNYGSNSSSYDVSPTARPHSVETSPGADDDDLRLPQPPPLTGSFGAPSFVTSPSRYQPPDVTVPHTQASSSAFGDNSSFFDDAGSGTSGDGRRDSDNSTATGWVAQLVIPHDILRRDYASWFFASLVLMSLLRCIYFVICVFNVDALKNNSVIQFYTAPLGTFLYVVVLLTLLLVWNKTLCRATREEQPAVVARSHRCLRLMWCVITTMVVHYIVYIVLRNFSAICDDTLSMFYFLPFYAGVYSLLLGLYVFIGKRVTDGLLALPHVTPRIEHTVRKIHIAVAIVVTTMVVRVAAIGWERAPTSEPTNETTPSSTRRRCSSGTPSSGDVVDGPSALSR
eukprot:PhM_4_TR15924/c3_g5_i7/m.54460